MNGLPVLKVEVRSFGHETIKYVSKVTKQAASFERNRFNVEVCDSPLCGYVDVRVPDGVTFTPRFKRGDIVAFPLRSFELDNGMVAATTSADDIAAVVPETGARK